MYKYELNMDDLGRIVIPHECRDKLGLVKNDRLDLTLTKDNKIILQRHYFDINCESIIRNALISIKGIQNKDYFISARQKLKLKKLITSFINEEFKDVENL